MARHRDDFYQATLSLLEKHNAREADPCLRSAVQEWYYITHYWRAAWRIRLGSSSHILSFTKPFWLCHFLSFRILSILNGVRLAAMDYGCTSIKATIRCSRLQQCIAVVWWLVGVPANSPWLIPIQVWAWWRGRVGWGQQHSSCQVFTASDLIRWYGLF